MQIKKSIIRVVAFEIMVLITMPACAQGESHERFKEADRIAYTRTGDSKLPFVFNYGTSFVISMNRGIPDVYVLRENLAKILIEKMEPQVIDKILFDFFGKTRPENLEIMIGSKVPLHISQAVIRVFSKHSDLPVILTINTVDGKFGNTQRVYIGGLVKTGKSPVSRETIGVLLSKSISREEFIRFVSELK